MSVSTAIHGVERANSGYSEHVDGLNHTRKTTTKTCFLLDLLPGDLRNIIYEKVFREPNGIQINLDIEPSGSNSSQHLTALAMTCKHIRAECSALPYWLNTFHFHVPLLQDASSMPPAKDYMAMTFPLPQRDPSPKRRLHMRKGDLTSKTPELREKAQQFLTMAMRIPHSDEMVMRFSMLVGRRHFMSQLRRCHVHLGSQTKTAFVARFFTAWEQVTPCVRSLRLYAEVRVSFELRISKRMVVAYHFGLADLESMVREMDDCVRIAMHTGGLTLPELSSVNAIRSTVCETLFAKDDGVK